MNTVRSCLLCALIICPVISGIQLLDSNTRKEVKLRLIPLSDPTPQSDTSIRPDFSKLDTKKFYYIAITHSACTKLHANVQSYYSFETSDDIEELIDKLKKPIIKSIFWYYYDKE